MESIIAVLLLIVCASSMSLSNEDFVSFAVSETAAAVRTNSSNGSRRQSELKTRSILASAAATVKGGTDESSVKAKQIAATTIIDDQILVRISMAIQSAAMTTQCSIALNKTISGIRMRQSWAVAMLDASVKVPIGVEYGAVYQFGNFDQCMSINSNTAINYDADDGSDIKPKYCLADVTVQGYSVRTGAVRKFELINSTLVHWGFCVPAVCSSLDATTLISLVTGHKNVTIHSDRCQTNDSTKLAFIDVSFSCIILAMVLMVMFSTCYHLCVCVNCNEVRPRGGLEQAMMAFSVIENVQRLMKASRDELGLSSLNGVKAIAMFFILAGHALLFMVGGPMLNSEFYAREIKLVQNAFLVNSPLLVDTFLLLSGFLFAHLLLVELEKRNGKVNFLYLYIFRYIRLTPAYFAVIALYATWLPKIGSGPLWTSRIGLESSRCQSSWWINILYINNYIGTDKLCMFQSWYLATDTQLFILAPLILYPLWKWRRMGVTALITFATASILIPLIITFVNDEDPSLLPYADEISDISANNYFVNAYIKTHMRATSYLFGLFTGYLVHYIREKKFIFSWTTQWMLWLISIVVGIGSMFSIVIFFGTNHPRSIRALYSGLHRLGWSFATSWFLLACTLDYAGPLKRILSSRALVPISRLTYCAYLSNGLVELYLAGSIRTPKYMSTISLLGETLSHVMLTFMCALVLCLLFESPIHGIEKIFLRKETQKPGLNSSLSPTALRNPESA